jgi:L-amino acid N-acyltransferase YncA
MTIRAAAHRDAEAIVAIHNEGIAERHATFETRPRTASEVADRIASERYPFLVAEVDGQVVGWVALAPYSEPAFYDGVAECSVYVAHGARGRGVGVRLLEEVAAEAAQRGFYKLIGKIFATNTPAAELVRRCGWREVGVHHRHGRLDGEWLDVLLVERLLGEAADSPIRG